MIVLFFAGIYSETRTFLVTHNNDDVEWNSSGGSKDCGSSDLELIWEDYEQIVGIRFENIIFNSQTETVTSAIIRFTFDEPRKESMNADDTIRFRGDLTEQNIRN